MTSLDTSRREASQSCMTSLPKHSETRPRRESSAACATYSSSRVKFYSFQIEYVPIYLCATMAEWLKGPYMYAVYQARGLNHEETRCLFLVGYVSAALFGTCVAAIVDTIGRKCGCLLFCVLYTVYALLHLHTSFWILFVARFVGGIASSLLFSSFESWCYFYLVVFLTLLLSG